MAFTGNLNTVAFSDILQLLSQGKKTGALAVTKGPLKKEVYFRNGNIVYALSANDEEDLLGNLLLKRGKISKPDLERAISLHKSTGKKLGVTLIELNLFSREEIVAALKLQIEEIVYNLFGWNEGEFMFYEGKAPSASQILTELPTASVMLEGARRIDEWVEIQKALPAAHLPLKLSSNPKIRGEEVTLSVDQLAVMSLIDGSRSYPEVLRASPMGEFVTSKALHQLVQNGLVEALPKSRSRLTSREEEELVFSVSLRVFSACFAVLVRVFDKKVGKNFFRRRLPPPQEKKGIDFYLASFLYGDEHFNQSDFLGRLAELPKEIRLHKLLTGLGAILEEGLLVVRLVLGEAVYKRACNDMRKEAGAIFAEERELVGKYDLETELYRQIRKG
ncbi:MAG: DUF4388 domain-containing protein [candidate division Zixibacteria bacterium]|nr:DUF4388 domain-containing protein [candidate division Zixibacteria bacterium]MCI0595669.1 DUF4388 domain-containing protein [candidate division Zixibacteria bacterium]